MVVLFFYWHVVIQKKNIMPFFSIMEKWNWTIIGFIYQLNEGNMANANYYCTTTKGGICGWEPNFMGNMNFRSKCAKVSWLLRYSVFSVFTKISWPICLSKLWKNQAGYNFFEDIPGFGLLHRFQKGSNFWKLLIQQLTYKQNSVWLVFELYNFPRNFFQFWSLF